MSDLVSHGRDASRQADTLAATATVAPRQGAADQRMAKSASV